MATARKLPSGNWRCLVYDYTDENGKRKYKSFTADTKKAAELAAAQYGLSDKSSRSELTVGQAIERYISSKDGVLSPSTIRGYRQMQKTYYGSISGVSVHKMTTEKMQKYISSITGTISAKTVANVYGLLSSAIAMFRPDAVFRVTLPKKTKPKKTAPSSEQVQLLFQKADKDLKVYIALAAFGGLRRGEICAIQYRDITNDIISIHADMVEDEHNKFIYKEIPKTSESIRMIRVPMEVIKLIGTGEPEAFIVERTPNAVTHAFTRLRNSLSLNICLHDLRHYFASIGAVIGVPDNYLSDFGGWRRGSGVMKEVYQGVIETEREKYQNMMTDHFSMIMQHEMQHESKKVLQKQYLYEADNGNRIE